LKLVSVQESRIRESLLPRALIPFAIAVICLFVNVSGFARPDIPRDKIPKDISGDLRAAIEALYVDDYTSRVKAARRLKGMGPAALPALPFLVGVFGDERTVDIEGERTRVTFEAQAALGAMGEGVLEPMFAGGLKKNRRYYHKFVAVMSKVGAPAVPFLIGKLKAATTRDERNLAGDTLSCMGDPALEPLLRLIQSAKEGEEPEYLKRAIEAVAELASGNAVPALGRLAFSRNAAVRQTAVDNLRDGELQMKVILEGPKDVRAPAVAGFAWNTNAAPYLVRLLGSEDEEIRREALNVTARNCEHRRVVHRDLTTGKVIKEPKPIDEKLVDALIAVMKNESDAKMRADAASVLVGETQERTLRAFRETFADEDETLKMHAARGLAAGGDAAGADLLLKVLSDASGHFGIRARAAQALADLGDVRAVGPLVKMALEDGGTVRERAAAALGRFKDDRVYPALEEMLGDRYVPARRAAILALDGLGDERAVKRLSELALRDKSSEIRRLCVNALGRAGKGSFEVLSEAARKDKDDRVRAAAVQAVAEIDHPGVPEVLRQVRRDDTDLSVRYYAKTALRKLGAPRVPAGRQGGEPAPQVTVEIDAVASRVKDAAVPGVEWLIYRKKFVARKEKDDLRNFSAFLSARGIEEIVVNGLAFSRDSVWAATGLGAFCFERKGGRWIEYAVNREHIGMPIDFVKAADDGKVTFTLKIDGKPHAYAFDPAASKWTQLE